MEALMQYVWQYRLWPVADMATVDGQRIEVVDVGMLNRDAGPDFFNAKVLIGGQMWSGNVEIHIRASDWMRHGHDKDPAYDSVVLHVVEKDDMPVYRHNGEKIPQMVMACARDFSDQYAQMVNNPALVLPCASELASVPSLYITDWLTALGHERLFAKSERVAEYARQEQGNWAHAVYATMARALGFGLNSEPFELLAQSMPLKILLRYTDSLLAIEALLFGQANLIPDPPIDEYSAKLADEYRFLATKHGLEPSSNIVWKMARMRPQNFPHRRIASLAAMIYGGFQAGSAMLTPLSESELSRLFAFDLTGYWARRYLFGEPTATGTRAFSAASASVLMINVAAPVLYAYGECTGDTRCQEAAIDLLQNLKPEKNSIIDIFASAGLKARDAFTSQALIQLRRQYCDTRKCLFCRLGHLLLSQKVKRRPLQ